MHVGARAHARAEQRGRQAMSASGEAAKTGEHFYACKWSRDVDSGAPLLLLAGEKGLVRVLDVAHECLLAVSHDSWSCRGGEGGGGVRALWALWALGG